MLVASEAEISELGIVKHEGSITAATVAVADEMTIYFPSDKIHRARSWTTQPLNAIESFSIQVRLGDLSNGCWRWSVNRLQ